MALKSYISLAPPYLLAFPKPILHLNSIALVIVMPQTEQEYILIINQAAYIPDLQQSESLLHSDQACYHGVKVNNISCYLTDHSDLPGKQNLEIDGITIPLLMMVLNISCPSDYLVLFIGRIFLLPNLPLLNLSSGTLVYTIYIICGG
jgi:hypothetical protein